MSSIKQRAPQKLKVLGRRLSVGAGQRTSALRLSPSFILAAGNDAALHPCSGRSWTIPRSLDRFTTRESTTSM